MKKNTFYFLMIGAVLLFCGCAGPAGGDIPSPANNNNTDFNSINVKINAKYSAPSEDNASGYWRVHDPKIFQDDDGTYYVYSTGWEGGVQIRKSTDLVNWTKVNSTFTYDSDFTDWVGINSTWAPTVIKQNGKYYMYHGIVNDNQTIGGNKYRVGAISLSIANSPEGPFVPAKTYDPSTYSQSTLVRCVWSNTESDKYSACYNTCNKNWQQGFGCIDPEFVFDIATGNIVTKQIGSTTCYAMTYGSWLGGIALIYVDSQTLKPVNQTTGKVMNAPLDSIADNSGVKIGGGYGSAYEGAQLIYNSNISKYFLFVSMGDLTYEYRVGVGRSDSITGPFLDASNRSMTFTDGTFQDGGIDFFGTKKVYHDYGSKIIGAWQFGENKGDEYGFRTPGGQSILRTKDGKIIFANHARTNYKTSNYFVLQLHQMFFTQNKWPVLNMNDYYDEAADETSYSAEAVAGEYFVNVTERSTNSKSFVTADNNTKYLAEKDCVESLSKSMTLNADGTVSGAYTGSWSLNGGKITLSLNNGTFSGVVMNAVDGAVKSESSPRIISITGICESTGAASKGEYIFANKKTGLRYKDFYNNAVLKSEFTATINEDSSDIKWYLYPQFSDWEIVTDDGSGESTAVTVSGAGAWWKGTDANKTAKVSVADGSTFTFYASTNAALGGTIIIEGISSASGKPADINPHDLDKWGAAAEYTAGNGNATVPTDRPVALKITIARNGNVYTIKVYQK